MTPFMDVPFCEMFRCRSLNPPSQDLEQVDQSPHSVHVQFTFGSTGQGPMLHSTTAKGAPWQESPPLRASLEMLRCLSLECNEEIV